MRPRKTPTSNLVFTLPDGNEDNDLHCERSDMGGKPVTISVWELDDEERGLLQNGGTIELIVWGTGHPPVALGVGRSMADRREPNGN